MQIETAQLAWHVSRVELNLDRLSETKVAMVRS
jgi:hypothetical protein